MNNIIHLKLITPNSTKRWEKDVVILSLEKETISKKEKKERKNNPIPITK